MKNSKTFINVYAGTTDGLASPTSINKIDKGCFFFHILLYYFTKSKYQTKDTQSSESRHNLASKPDI